MVNRVLIVVATSVSCLEVSPDHWRGAGGLGARDWWLETPEFLTSVEQAAIRTTPLLGVFPHQDLSMTTSLNSSCRPLHIALFTSNSHAWRTDQESLWRVLRHWVLVASPSCLVGGREMRRVVDLFSNDRDSILLYQFGQEDRSH
jgi:hypothetical protein